MITGEVFPGEDAEVLVEAIKNDYSGEDIDGITNPVVYVKWYKQAVVKAVGATAVYNSTMGQYLITIPSTYVPDSGTFDGVLKGDDIADVLFRLQVNTADSIISTLATSAALISVANDVTAVKVVTDTLSLEAINAEVDTAISDAAIVSKIDTVDTVVDGIATTLATPDNFKADVSSLATSAEVAAVGAEKIVPADKYTFDASESTITLTTPYDTVTVEQVISIRNITKNMLLYDCTMTNRSSISIDAGVITHTYSGTMANTDKLMIIVNMA